MFRLNIKPSVEQRLPTEILRAVTAATEGNHIAILEDAYSWIGRWRTADEVRVDFVKGLRQTIVGIILIWGSVRGSGQTSLCTRRLNQDG